MDFEDGAAGKVTIETVPSELGDSAFVSQIAIGFEGDEEMVDVAFTSVAVLHGEIVFTVDLTDGLSTTGPIPRDPTVALDVATKVDQKVAKLLAD